MTSYMLFANEHYSSGGAGGMYDFHSSYTNLKDAIIQALKLVKWEDVHIYDVRKRRIVLSMHDMFHSVLIFKLPDGRTVKVCQNRTQTDKTCLVYKDSGVPIDITTYVNDKTKIIGNTNNGEYIAETKVTNFDELADSLEIIQEFSSGNSRKCYPLKKRLSNRK